METLKKILLLLLALAMVFCFAACSEEEPEETDPTLNQGDENCEHVWSDWEVTKENSCTKTGKQERECVNCGKEEVEELLAYGHSYYGGVCIDCEREEKECEHPESYMVVLRQATCYDSGEERKVCKLCKAVLDTDYIDPYWHSETETVILSEATCTEDGLKQEICKLCGEVASERTLWATGHEETERVVVQEATCTENGLYQDICKLCGEVDYEGTLWSNGHTYEYVDSQAPTCTEVGWYSYSYCTVCNYVRNYSEKAATGHSYRMDTCQTCGFVNTDFVMQSAPGVVESILPYTPAELLTYTGEAAKIEKYVGDINTKGQEDVYTLEAAVAGTYCIQVKEVYSGKNFDLYLYDALGKVVTSDTYCVNGDYIYAELEVGTYTIKLKQDSGYSTYELYVFHKKPIPDASSYDVISDSMEYPKQNNNYYFTPTVSGVYGFTFSEILSNSDLVITLYNHLGEQVLNSDRGNGSTVYATLEAGENYKIKVYNDDDKITPYVLTIGKPRVTVNLDGYTGAEGALTFDGQEDYFTFTATSSSYVIITTGNTADVKLYLKNYLGENVKDNTYCGNGEGITISNLTIGETYTVKVARRYDNVNYTLHLYTPKASFAVTSDMAVTDALEYSGQQNSYTFTVTREGEHKVLLILNSYSNYSYLSITIYDANGKSVKSDSSVYDGNYFSLSDLTVGSVYTIVVSVYSGTANYTLSIQP